MCFTKHPNYLSTAWGILGKGLVKKIRKPDKSASRVWGTVLDKPKAQNLPHYKRERSSNGKPSSFSHSITSHTLLTLSVGVSFQVALPALPVHSSGGALPRFRRGNSGAKQPLTSNHFFSIPDTERY
ncbi:hypothetical protein PIB30_064356 [Stylosanthes scabra]|uniref:Uncharacterized protein n=1 Tax=Stylosanthes scabra TaxID=79078 RepID=A0ABU6TMM2_9FABA|nr:hypothetical protein [Stylosanthes scabra]